VALSFGKFLYMFRCSLFSPGDFVFLFSGDIMKVIKGKELKNEDQRMAFCCIMCAEREKEDLERTSIICDLYSSDFQFASLLFSHYKRNKSKHSMP
jgi:hypothetical protein